MKKLFIIFIAITAFLACEKAVVNVTDEPQLRVENVINDISLEEGIIEQAIDLSKTFKVYGDDNAEIITSIYSNQNTALVQSQIMGDTLYLTINIGQIGSSEITLRAEWANQVKYESFVLTVNDVTTNEASNTAIQYFQNGDYANAEIYFQVVISKNDVQFLSDAYMGLGFSQMRNSKAPESYLSLQSSISENNANYDAKAGLSLLEYSYTNNYSEAIRYSNEVLISNNNFMFRYDSNLDYHDMLVNKALSQYASQLFDDCLLTIQQLDSSFILLSTDPDYKTKLYQKLQELVGLYR